jgi:exopolysaccharide production protein ExoQ
MDLLRLNPAARAFLTAIGGLGLVVVVAALTARESLLLGLAGAAGVGAFISAARHPRLALCVYAATIPLETVQIEGFATISRVAGAAFFAGYVVGVRGIRLEALRTSAWAFVALATLSILWSVGTEASIASVVTLLQLFLITIMVADAISRDPAIARLVLWSYAAAASVTAVLAIAAYATNRTTLIAERAGAFAQQDVAQFAALILPALVFLVGQAATGDRRLLAAAGAALCGFAILLSGTRSAWLAIIVGLGLALVPRLRAGQVAVLVALVAGIALVALQIPTIGEAITGRVESAAETGGAGRLDIWAVGIAIFLDHPIVGVGQGAFPIAFTDDVIRSAAVPGLNLGVLTEGRGSHSLLLSTAGELGLMGLVLLAWLVRDLLRSSREPLASVVQGMIVAVLVQSLLLDVLARKQVWLVIGLAMGLDYARRRRRSRAAQDEEPAYLAALGDIPSTVAGPAQGRHAIG